MRGSHGKHVQKRSCDLPENPIQFSEPDFYRGRADFQLPGSSMFFFHRTMTNSHPNTTLPLHIPSIFRQPKWGFGGGLPVILTLWCVIWYPQTISKASALFGLKGSEKQVMETFLCDQSFICVRKRLFSSLFKEPALPPWPLKACGHEDPIPTNLKFSNFTFSQCMMAC